MAGLLSGRCEELTAAGEKTGQQSLHRGSRGDLAPPAEQNSADHPTPSVGGPSRAVAHTPQPPEPGPGHSLKRADDDPVPCCPECHGLLRRVPAEGLSFGGIEGYEPKTWYCDIDGPGIIPEWIYRTEEVE